jgi:DNA polymerase-1
MSTHKKIFVIIDSHALIHRAFHAIPPMTTTKGEPVHAVYGFYAALIKILKDIHPDYCAVTFDLPQKTFRHESFDAYKAHRPKAPDELISQIKMVREILPSFGIAQFEMPKYEADDIIGTLVKKLSRFDGEILIVTGDLDTLQLVDKRTNVLTLKKGITETARYGEKEIMERWGLAPDQMIDFKALKGDPSDNIPGVPGIGEKTAITLLKEYKTLERVYLAAEQKKSDIKESLRKKLIEHKEQALFSKQLSTINIDVAIDFDQESCKTENLSLKKARESLAQHELPSLARRLQEFEGGGEGRAPEEKNKPELSMDRPAATIAAEIMSIEKATVLGICVLSGDRWQLWWEERTALFNESDIISNERFCAALCSPRISKICADAKPAYKVLLAKKQALFSAAFDVVVAYHTLYPERTKDTLKDISTQFCGKEIETLSAAEFMQLAETLKKATADKGLSGVVYDIEMPLTPVIAKMEVTGIRFDINHLKKIHEEIKDKLAELEKNIYQLSGKTFNINSPKQVSEILFGTIGITSKGIRKTSSGQISTRSSELEKIQSENSIAQKILEYRELAKLQTTYIEALPSFVGPDGKIHGTFQQYGAATGRFSSQEPNLQNIPTKTVYGQEIRKAFLPEKGKIFLSFDYSQIELRIVASLSHDAALIKAFKEGGDVHRATAAAVFKIPPGQVTEEIRHRAKAMNFGIMYGMGPKGFAESSGLDIKEAKRFMEEYLAEFSGMKKYLDSLREAARQKGYVETLFGRRRYLDDIHSSQWQARQAAERAAINMPLQGTAADIIKMAMVATARALDAYCKKHRLPEEKEPLLVLQIHDELIFEVDERDAEELLLLLQEAMETVVDLTVPLVVKGEKGKSLGDL